MENTDVAQILAEVADLLELTGGDPFKARAYRQAAQIIDLLATFCAAARAGGTARVNRHGMKRSSGGKQHAIDPARSEDALA